MYVWFEPHSVRNIFAHELEEGFHNFHEQIRNLPGLLPFHVELETITLPDRIQFKISSDEPIESNESIYLSEIPNFNRIVEESSHLGVWVSEFLPLYSFVPSCSFIFNFFIPFLDSHVFRLHETR